MRASSLFFTLILALTGLFLVSLYHGFSGNYQLEGKLAATCTFTRELGITDLALFTEARYTRHPSQADLHAAFQDHPLALEHFPTGSLVPVPNRLRQ